MENIKFQDNTSNFKPRIYKARYAKFVPSATSINPTSSPSQQQFWSLPLFVSHLNATKTDTPQNETTQLETPMVHLPPEIRIMILKIVANQKHPGWASLASVCREWQDVLEEINFHKISLQVSHLDDFAVLSPQKRKLIHHIYFSIELPRYRYRCCSERRSRLVDINPIVNEAVRRLFSILSLWVPSGNLALELNVYSPSDCEHWFKKIHLSSDNVDHEGDTTPTAWTGALDFDPVHG
ncbi:hypothetical protein J3F84DRAFT_132712 [Trichoderma pleuroticola]